MTTTVKPLNGFVMVALDHLHPSPNNPREKLTGIEDLAVSIREVGLIQPIIAQRIPGHDGLQIVAGHRRHAAARAAGLTEVACVVRRDLLPDEELLTMLVENGQRAGLDPIEEARALNTLKRAGMADMAIARKIGRGQSYVSGRLALLALPPEEQEELRAGVVSITAATQKARATSGKVRPRANGRSPVHLGPLHDLAGRAKARCTRLNHKRGHGTGVGGIACGECWESVIRADERQHLHDQSDARGRCVLCDTRPTPSTTNPTGDTAA